MEQARIEAIGANAMQGVKQNLNGTSLITGRFDFNRDGKVNALDLAVAKAHFNRSLSMSAAPVAAAAAATAAVQGVAPANVFADAAVPTRSTSTVTWR